MNPFLKGLIGWAINAAKTEGQELGLKALNDATGQLSKVLNQHAPDLAPHLQPLIQQLVQGGVAGILSKTGG